MTERQSCTLAVAVCLVGCALISLVVPHPSETPQGAFQNWQWFYSPSEKAIIHVDRYENGYWRDLDCTGNPFDRKKAPRHVPLTETLRLEMQEVNKQMVE